MAQIDLPAIVKQDSGAATRLFFDTYGIKPLEFSSNEVEAAVGFFKNKGFEEEAALTTGITISSIIRNAMSLQAGRYYFILNIIGVLSKKADNRKSMT